MGGTVLETYGDTCIRKGEIKILYNRLKMSIEDIAREYNLSVDEVKDILTEIEGRRIT